MLLVFVTIPMTLVAILVHPASAQQIRNRRLPPAVKKKPSGLMLPDNATSIRENIVDTFSCDRRIYGYYADVANECQIFHVCVPRSRKTLRFSFICPAETIFNQISFVCTREEDSIPCAESERYYSRNEVFGKENEHSTQTNIPTNSQNNGTDDSSSTSSGPSSRPTRPTARPSTTYRPTAKPTSTTTTTGYPSSTQIQTSSTQQRPTWRPTTMGYLPSTQSSTPQQRPTTRPTTTSTHPSNANPQETSSPQWPTSRPPTSGYPQNTYPQRPQTPQTRPPTYPTLAPSYQNTSYQIRPNTNVWYYAYGVPYFDSP